MKRPSSRGANYTDLVKRRGNGRLSIAAGRDVSGWEAYRRWLSQVQAPDTKRLSLDPTLYTWRGYRSWAEQMRRDWDNEK
jgi:hypothetical protein